MRHNIIAFSFFIISVILSAPIYADEDCDLALREAKTAYNAGEYTKAKKLYDYVVSICGPTYGNASSLSQKCQDALTPKLSVSRSSISVSANAGTTSITVTSNRTWKLTNTNSSLYTVSRNGDNISISYSANPNTTSRSDYFDIVTTDGSKSVRVYINQAANTTPYLSVNKNSISASASGTTEYITVSSNTTWEVQYASGSMYYVTRNGNTLTVNIYANSSTDSRTNFFCVRTTDGTKMQKIYLSQSGKSSSSASSYNNSATPTQYQVNQMKATVKSVWVDHNVSYSGEKCMKIHTHFSVENMKGFQGYIIVWVYDNYDNLQTSYKTDAKYNKYINSSHAILSWDTFMPTYTPSQWSDYVLYLPNSLLSKGGYLVVEIREPTTSTTLAMSNKVSFTYGN